MGQSAYLVINQITVDNYAALLLHAGGSGDRLYDGPDLKLFVFVGWDRSYSMLLGPPPSSFASDCFRFPVVLFGRPGVSIC